MGYTLPQIAVILAKADRTMYKIGAIAYDDMFNQLDESLDYDRDITYIYKVAVEYADNFYVGTEKLDTVVERLGAKVAVYDFGQLTPIYSDSTIVTQVVPVGAALDDLSDVTITNVQNNQTLRYSSSLGQWVNVGPGASVRNRQQFTATLNQTVFVTSFQFESGLLDVYLNGVKLSPPSYTTFGNYTITLADGSLADDIVEVIAYAPETSFIDLSGYVPTSRTLTINGVTYDLSANRSWTVTAGLSSVGLSMPSGFTVSNSPLTANGTISVIGAGTTAQYIRGDGSLATFPALTGYIPYTGATANVDLGEFGIRAGQFTLDTSPTGTAAVGTTRWNDALGSSETTLKGGSVILKNGVDLVARIVNKVTPNATLTKAAYQVVRVSGAQGQRLAVAYAQANNDNNSADTLGLVIETIPTNQEGFIITMGQIENINTTGSLQGETWVDGDVLYLSPTTPGAITKVKPTGAGHIVVIGYVEYAHVNNGKIYVKVMNGWELDELHDVDIVSPTNNEALIYESSTSLWKNKTIATALGYTPISGTGVSGQVAYWNGTNSQTGSNNFTWDNAVGKLNLNSTTQYVSISANTGLSITNSSTSANGVIGLTGSGFILQGRDGASTAYPILLQPYGGNVGIGISSPTRRLHVVGTSALFQNAGTFELDLLNTTSGNYLRATAGTTDSNIGTIQNIPFSFIMNGSRVGQFTSTNGNLILQNGGTFVDSGYRLDVNGTARVSSTITLNGSIVTSTNPLRLNSYIVASASGFTINNNADTDNNFIVSDNGNTRVYRGSLTIGSVIGTGTGALFAGAATFSSSVTAIKALIGDNGFGSQWAVFNHADSTGASNAFVGIDNSNGSQISNIKTNGTFEWRVSNSNVMNLKTSGNLLLGTTTDAGYKLDVNGTARVSGSANTILTLNSTNGTGYSAIKIDSSGVEKALIGFGTYLTSDAGVAIRTAASTPFTIAIGGGVPTLTLATSGAATFSSSVTATSFVKSGGTSSQYLMADGSVTTGGGGSVDELQVSLICQVFG